MTPGAPLPAVERRDQLATALLQLRARIERAVEAAGRQDSPTLIAVTKTYPVEDVAALASLGVSDIGENRGQELVDKRIALTDQGATLTWHFIGQIQSRQAHRIGQFSDVVHSVDRISIATRLGAAAVEGQRDLAVLVQVSLDGDPDRGGVEPGQLMALADQIAETDGLTVAGLMAVPPLAADPVEAYRRLAQLSAQLLAVHASASMISAGMSGDLEAAISAGATHLRVGTALLGRRSVPLG